MTSLRYEYDCRPENKHRWVAWHNGVRTALYLSPELFDLAVPRVIHAVITEGWRNEAYVPLRLSVPLHFDREHTETVRYRPHGTDMSRCVGQFYLPNAIASQPPHTQLRADLHW